MMKYLIRLFLIGATIFAISYYVPSLIQVTDFTAALKASLVLAVINLLFRPVLGLIAKPLNTITFGFFSLFMNAVLLYIVSFLLSPSFRIMGWWQALLAGLIISAVSTYSKN